VLAASTTVLHDVHMHTHANMKTHIHTQACMHAPITPWVACPPSCVLPPQVATDADIRQQLESGAKAFDLVDHDLLPDANRLRLRKHTNFAEVKRLVSHAPPPALATAFECI